MRKIIFWLIIVGCLLVAIFNHINNIEKQNLQTKLDTVCTLAESRANEAFVHGYLSLEIPNVKPELINCYELILRKEYGFKEVAIRPRREIGFCGNSGEEEIKMIIQKDSCSRKAIKSLFISKFGKLIYSTLALKADSIYEKNPFGSDSLYKK